MDDQNVGKSIGRFVKKHVRQKGKKFITKILKLTAPIWGPLLLIFILAFTAYMILFGIPTSALMGNEPANIQTAAFLGVSENPKDVPAVDTNILEQYKTISNTWDDGLTQEQQSQVMVYKFPWSILAAVDRVVNDEAVWEGKQNVVPQLQAVFDALRPKFSWKDSTITTVTVTVSTDSKGNRVTSKSTSVKHISLVTSADTIEGHFGYTYKWQTTTTATAGGGSITVTREVVKNITQPPDLYAPLKQYLKDKRGITDQTTYDLVWQLAKTYDPEYMIDVSMQGGQNYATYPAYALAYADEVQQVLMQHPNIPQPLFLALIAHESGGNWQAVNQNSNNTTDAGLCQINSTNWSSYGLTNNPFNVPSNIGAGASILGNNLDQYNDITKALYAYNGGTASNGETYNPSYAPSVLAIFMQLQSTPDFAVYVPSSAGEPLTILAAEQNGSTWQAYGQSGVDFTNPQDITVTDERTGDTVKADRTSGDGTMWAQEAWVYCPSLTNIQKGDKLKIQFDDGKSTEITSTK